MGRAGHGECDYSDRGYWLLNSEKCPNDAGRFYRDNGRECDCNGWYCNHNERHFDSKTAFPLNVASCGNEVSPFYGGIFYHFVGIFSYLIILVRRCLAIPTTQFIHLGGVKFQQTRLLFQRTERLSWRTRTTRTCESLSTALLYTPAQLPDTETRRQNTANHLNLLKMALLRCGLYVFAP